ncbi:hypothetical protein, partial [Asanoa ferruginea]
MTDSIVLTTPLPAGRRRITAWAALAGAAVSGVVGAIQAMRPFSDDPLVDRGEHVILALCAVMLVLWIPGYLALGAEASPAKRRLGRIGAWSVVVGTGTLAVAMTASNLHNEDYPWFAALAIPANGLWGIGSILLAVATYRARTLPRPIAAALPLIWLTSIVLSQQGGNLVAGALWAAIGWL